MGVIISQTCNKSHDQITDGPEVLLKCSGCDKPLVYIWSNRPKQDIDLTIRANCCYCDDHSFPIKRHGGCGARGYDKQLDCPENVRPIVNITNISINYDDLTVTIETEKV